MRMSGAIRRMKALWRTLAGAAVAVLLVPLGGCDRPADGDGQVLRVGTHRGGTRGMMLAAGELKDVPYRIEWAQFPSAQTQIEAISANAVDVGIAGVASFLFAYNGNPQLRAIQAMDGGPEQKAVAVIVPEKSPARDMRDLRGRSIATTRGSVGHITLLQALEQAHLKTSDVSISFLSPNDAMTAFATGKVDALAIWLPYLATAVRSHHARVLTYAWNGTSNYLVQVSSDASVRAKHALLEDFLRRYARAQLWANGHPREWSEISSRETGVPRDIAAYSAERWHWTPAPVDGRVADALHETARIFAAELPPPHRDGAAGLDSSFDDAVDGSGGRRSGG